MKRIITMTAAMVVGSLSLAMAGSNAVADVGGMVVKPPANRLIDRTIEITPATQRIDIRGGETVRFIVRGPGGTKEFVRHFRTYQQNPAPFELTQIGPQNTSTTLGGEEIRVSVSPDPRYMRLSE